MQHHWYYQSTFFDYKDLALELQVFVLILTKSTKMADFIFALKKNRSCSIKWWLSLPASNSITTQRKDHYPISSSCKISLRFFLIFSFNNMCPSHRCFNNPFSKFFNTTLTLDSLLCLLDINVNMFLNFFIKFLYLNAFTIFNIWSSNKNYCQYKMQIANPQILIANPYNIILRAPN